MKADALCALNVCFEKERIEALADEGKKIDLVKKGENWNLLRYTFKKFGVFESKTTWLRTIYPDKNKVTFKLVDSRNSHSIMPKIITGAGYYSASKSGDYIQFEYYSKCTLSRVALTGLLIKFAKKGLWIL
ncbi:MAG: hypothetical protein HC831_11185 [Chloroflexia bacterium]|nr:hypothetical protein [Chloroflexia bacterium]